MNTLILATTAAAVAGAEAKRVVEGKPLAVEPVIGGFVLGIGLFAFAAVNENVTRLFCILIILTALLLNGATIFSLTNKAID